MFKFYIFDLDFGRNTIPLSLALQILAIYVKILLGRNNTSVT